MSAKNNIFVFLILFFSFSRLILSYNDISGLNLVEPGCLKVSTNIPYEPWEYKSGDEIVGVDIDVAKKVVEKIEKSTNSKIELKVNDVSFDALTLELVNRKCDMAIAGMSASEERRKSVDFSNPYFVANQAVIVKRGSNIKSPSDLPDKKIGVQLGTTGHTYCEEHNYDTHTYNSGVDAIMSLLRSDIDAVVIDELPAKRLAQKNKSKVEVLDDFLFSEEYRIALPKGNEKLKNLINEALAELPKNFVEERLAQRSFQEQDEKLGFIDQFRINLIDENRWQQILRGLLITFKITISSLLIGVCLGYLTALTMLSKSNGIFARLLKFIAKTYISVIRGTPVVCQLFIVYYLLLSPLGAGKILCAIIAFGVNSGAYVSEIIRSGILSVDAGQIEAGKALGLEDNQIMRYIIAPQALKNSLATLCNEFMQLIKETSVAGFIGVTELTRAGEIIRSQTLSPFVPLVTTALIYFVIVHLIGMLMSFFERRLRVSDKS